jgi:hypothetical protein
MINKKNQSKNVNTTNNNNNKNDYISSLTPFDKLFNNDIDNIRTNGEINNNNNKKNEFIDIIGDNSVLDDNSEELIRINKKIKHSAEHLEYNLNYDYLLEMSSGGKYVKEQLNMVSFNFLV